MSTRVFSLENHKAKIYDRRSRKYFDEVYKSYANGCLRSATVMLWSVVVCDLIFKLQELRDLYDDKTAEKILAEVEELQNSDPYSPKWEKELVKMVFERTQLLDTSSYHKLSVIQDHRHLSAHPVISDEDTLFEPTDEMVKSDIRNSIETLLSKPPYLTQKIVGTILSDLEKTKNMMPNDSALSKYLDAKYLGSLNVEVMIKVFRGLWKFCFRLEDDKANENREINTRALALIYKKEKPQIQEAIKAETAYYSHISSQTDIIENLISFISLEKPIYDALNDAAKELINPVLTEDLTNFATAFFISDNPGSHIEKISSHVRENLYRKYGEAGSYIKKEQLKTIRDISDQLGLDDKYRKLCIACFINSSDFERADMYYDRFIDPNLNSFTKEELLTLLEGSNKNNQVYWRNRSRIGNDSVKMLQAAKAKFDPGHDFSVYGNLPIDRIDEDIEPVEGEV
ncbi:hypothetical protein [Catenovulum sediminis]|uniref:hypothetical protein n=1 Tax=Catenovulum sediminis TaxID=1740262 RepID=UPI00117EFE47|nr:hypothetical protein [Catenovulum sediminis]